MDTLRTFTYADIMALEPCYDPVERGYITADWHGTALDVLRHPDAPAQDKLWLVLRDGWVDDRTLRLFAVWCARQALALVDAPDARSVAACDVAERYANGDATYDELDAVRAAAWDAAWAAASAAASAAAWAAAWAAASAAAWDAASAAAGAARDAAWDAAEAARDAAWDAACAAAGAAAGAAQVRYLVRMLETHAPADAPPAAADAAQSSEHD